MDLPFGFTIERKKANGESTGSAPKKSENVYQSLKFEGVSGYEPLNKLVNTLESDFFNRIIWPPKDRLNAFERVAYDEAIFKFLGGKDRIHKHFSICTLDRLHALKCFRYTDETRKIYEDLRHLHCVDWKNIPPDIMIEMPALLSAIFTEGRSLKEVKDAPPQTTHLLGEL